MTRIPNVLPADEPPRRPASGIWKLWMVLGLGLPFGFCVLCCGLGAVGQMLRGPDSTHSAPLPTGNPAVEEGGRKWYEGGALHRAKMRDWKKATHANKLATAADFVVSLMKVDGEDVSNLDLDRQVRPAAERLVRELDAAAADNVTADQDVSTAVSFIHTRLKQKGDR